MIKKIFLFMAVVLFAMMTIAGSAWGTFQYSTSFGSAGSGPGQFNAPIDVAVDSQGNVYVADSANNRIQKFTAQGEYITSMGDGHFSGAPTGIAIDGSDNVYVVNFCWIEKFTSGGQWVSRLINGQVSGDGAFETASDAAIDSQGNIYVHCANLSNNQRIWKIKKFNSLGTYLSGWETGSLTNNSTGQPCGVNFDSTGNLYVPSTSDAGKCIYKFTNNGAVIWSKEVYMIPNGLAVASIDGKVYFGAGSNTIRLKSSENGDDLEEIRADELSGTVVGLALNKNEDLLYATVVDGNKVAIFAPSSPTQQSIQLIIKVVDSRGNAVNGAEVTATPQGSSSIVGTTNERGLATFTAALNVPYHVVAWKNYIVGGYNVSFTAALDVTTPTTTPTSGRMIRTMRLQSSTPH